MIVICLREENKHILLSLIFSIIEDGYACIKECYPMDHICLGNFTKELLYQFSAIPTLKKITKPIEVSKIRVQMDIPFSVEYVLDRRNQEHFIVEQKENLGNLF